MFQSSREYNSPLELHMRRLSTRARIGRWCAGAAQPVSLRTVRWRSLPIRTTSFEGSRRYGVHGAGERGGLISRGLHGPTGTSVRVPGEARLTLVLGVDHVSRYSHTRITV